MLWLQASVAAGFAVVPAVRIVLVVMVAGVGVGLCGVVAVLGAFVDAVAGTSGDAAAVATQPFLIYIGSLRFNRGARN